VSLPAVTTIGSYAFYGCNELRIVFLSGETVVSGSGMMFYGTDGHRLSLLSIYVPDSLVTEYKSNFYWSGYSSEIFGHSQMPL
jgi:hypothetical protein